MHYLLFYDYVDDYLERREALRADHLTLAWRAQQRGELLLGGVMAEPVDGAVLLFEAETPQIVEAFVDADPYVRNGLVTAWRIRPWHTVVGETASDPIRPA